MTQVQEPGRPEQAAALLGSVGAAVAGLGGGVLLAGELHRFGWSLLVVGGAAHFGSMISKRRAEARSNYRPAPWERIGYWLCWAALGAIALSVLVGLLRP